MSTANAGALAFKVCVHLLKNPGAVIFSDEIVRRWGPRKSSLFSQLERARESGLLVGEKKKGEPFMYFYAGPALLKLWEES